MHVHGGGLGIARSLVVDQQLLHDASEKLNSSLLLSPLLLRAPKGDGHPVLALPGFLASDLSMAPMRRYL